MDVLSYIRSTIAVWGTSIWCPDQPNSLREALADLSELFFPVLAGILSVPRLAPYSKRCLRRELGWLGYEEVLIQSQLQLLRTMLCMPYDRLPKQLLLLRLSRLAPQTTSPPPFPQPSFWEREARLPHLCASTTPQPANTLALGPATPRVHHRVQRINLLIGLTPAQALTVTIPTSSTGLARYRWEDLQYDLQQEVLVIPAYEALIRPAEQHQHCPQLPSRQPHQNSGQGFNDYVRQVYSQLKPHPQQEQGPIRSSFLASVQAIIHHCGPLEALTAFHESQWLLEDNCLFPQILQRARQHLAKHLWIGTGILSPRTSHALSHYPNLDADLQIRLAPHLTLLRNSSPSTSLYVIIEMRKGALALGSRIDVIYPHTIQYCPCCGELQSDDIAHQLLGACRRTRPISDPHRTQITQLMWEWSPHWTARYTHPGTSSQERASLLLHAPDQSYLTPDRQLRVATLLAQWINKIVEHHPLCARQRAGTHHSQLRYHQGNFDYLPWTPSDDALLLEATAERVYDLFPGKPRDKVLRRLQILNRRAAERNV